jgi:hypothetical protein
LTKLFGSHDGCKVTNSLLRTSPSKLPGKYSRNGKTSASDPIPGSSPDLMPTGKFSGGISPKEVQELKAILISLVGKTRGSRLTNTVTTAFRLKYLIKHSNSFGKEKIIKMILKEASSSLGHHGDGPAGLGILGLGIAGV